jgi:hypothetical protein
MKRKSSNADRGAIDRCNPDRGPEIIAIHIEPPNAIFGVLAYFSVLAYPDSADSEHRANFAMALHSWRCKNVRENMADWENWERLSAETREMTNRSIKGKLNMGLKRIEKRLKAGFIAYKIYINGRPMPSFNPTARSGKGLVMGRGADSVTEGLLEILREDNEGRRYDPNEEGVIEREVLENHRRVIWTVSLPVLHIATSLEVILRGLEVSLPDVPRLALVHRLFHDPRWLSDALADSEWWRLHLVSAGIPGFDKDKAIRLVPADRAA